MANSFAWPDLVIGAIVLIAALKGFKRGFISELSGAIALVLSFLTPWWYNGAFDATLSRFVHVGPGSAHVVGMFLTGVGTYIVVLAIARLLNGITKLPLLGIGNALAGAAIGIAKAAVGLWIVLYVALLFPLAPDLRADFHKSALVHVLTTNDTRVDDAITATLPWFVRPFAHHYFAGHQV
ncbi:MAG: CvpA family protein [Candidatus Eremiobacteraeota bacterium]|nr:CvpA family protein [Candidatus Eremiobacteraeota bacterium]